MLGSEGRARAFLFAGAALAGTGLVALFSSGCPPKMVARPYPAPAAEELLAHLRARAGRVHSVRADAKVDYLADHGDRVKVSMMLVAADPDRLRMDAESPFGGTVASLASDGKQFEFLDVRNNRFLSGEATPCNIARLIRIELQPADVVTALEGSAPLLAGDDIKAEVSWDGRDGGRDVLTLHASSGQVETISLDAKDRHWDVMSAELHDGAGAVLWRLTHSDFHDNGSERMPSRTTIEQPGRHADARIKYRSEELNVELPAAAFQLSPPAGVPVEPVRCQ